MCGFPSQDGRGDFRLVISVRAQKGGSCRKINGAEKWKSCMGRERYTSSADIYVEEVLRTRFRVRKYIDLETVTFTQKNKRVDITGTNALEPMV